MVQTDLSRIRLTELEQLQRNRQILYDELVNEIKQRNIHIRQLTYNYSRNVKQIDERIIILKSNRK